MRLDPDTQRSLDAVDALIDKLELPQATEQLVALVEELKQQPLKVHGCIQAMDVLGQCYIMQRQLKKALKVYDNLVQMVEGSRELSESRLYVAGYAIRGGLHEKIADSGYAQRCARLLPPCTPLEWPSTFAAGYRRDADYKTATDGGAPVGRLRTYVSLPIRRANGNPWIKAGLCLTRRATAATSWTSSTRRTSCTSARSRAARSRRSGSPTARCTRSGTRWARRRSSSWRSVSTKPATW